MGWNLEWGRWKMEWKLECGIRLEALKLEAQLEAWSRRLEA
jgi:hypothetical protein